MTYSEQANPKRWWHRKDRERPLLRPLSDADLNRAFPVACANGPERIVGRLLRAAITAERPPSGDLLSRVCVRAATRANKFRLTCGYPFLD